ncbi:MAG: hypothetical protein COB50_04885 [Thiotrichales bacterium]|nr:MAG: hypothetical protein COB50_04885 [Thiotrichales bacterium]
MGFIPGKIFTIISKSPLGNPYKVHINGTNLALRVEEIADNLLYEVSESS